MHIGVIDTAVQPTLSNIREFEAIFEKAWKGAQGKLFDEEKKLEVENLESCSL
jgi:hypothetical protein